MSDLLCILCGVLGPPHAHGAPSLADLELSRLREEVERLTKERDAMLFAACGFCEEVDRAESHANRPRGGQHVTPSGDFIYAQPSVLGRLKWWARAFKDAGSSVEYAVKTLEAERDSARAEAAALRQKLDFEILENRTTRADEWIEEEREACAKVAERSFVVVIDDPDDDFGSCLQRDIAAAIRARGQS